MILTDFITNAYLIGTGKVTPPASGTAKYNKLVALANLFTQNWASESGVDWKSLRTVATVAGAVTATDAFALPTTLGKLSKTDGDYVRILCTDGTETQYTIVPIERLYEEGSKLNAPGNYTCAVSGSNLIFNRAFTATDREFGGTIYVPGYITPATLSAGTDVIQVDDPYWLVFAVAAEFIRTDITRAEQYGNLIAQANNSMAGMVQDNESQREQVTATWSPLGETW